MATYSTTRLDNGTLLTVTGPHVAESVTFYSDHRPYFRVEERNEVGVFVGVVFTSPHLGQCEQWVTRADERGYALHPSLGDTIADLIAAERKVTTKLRPVAMKLTNEHMAPGSEDTTDLVAAAEALKNAAHDLYMLARRYEEGI